MELGNVSPRSRVRVRGIKEIGTVVRVYPDGSIDVAFDLRVGLKDIKEVVDVPGLEPGAYGLSSRRSNQLSYTSVRQKG